MCVNMKPVLVVLFFCLVLSNVIALAESDNDVTSRGKKKKIDLLIYFADIIIKKLFIFKLVYAFIFFCVIHKAGYFLTWFISYLKEQKTEFSSHHHHTPHQNYQEYGPAPHYSSYGPYRRMDSSQV